MSLLVHRDQEALRLPQTGLLPEQERTDVSGAGVTTCLCGTRVPLQVRLGLKSRTRPVLDGRWCCSDQCLRARVASLVRRSMPNQPQPRMHRHRIPVGLLLLRSGKISREQLRQALKLSGETGQRVGEVLVRDCAVPEEAVAEALAQQWGCDSWDIRGMEPEFAACLAPQTVLAATGMLPVRELSPWQIGVAFADQPDPQGILALQRIHVRSVEAGLAVGSHFTAANDQVQAVQGVACVETQCAQESAVVREVVRSLQRLQPVECRLARVHSMFWLRMWLEPAALARGLMAREDVVDYVLHLPETVHMDRSA